jgi:hypothetical protein
VWTAAAVPLVFLSFMAAKEGRYMIAVTPALCALLAMAWEFWNVAGPKRVPRWLKSNMVVVVIVAIYLLLMTCWNPIYETRESAKRSPKAMVARVLAAESAERPVVYYEKKDAPVYFYMGGARPMYWEGDADMVEFLALLRAKPGTIVWGQKGDIARLLAEHPDLRLRRIIDPPRRGKIAPYSTVDLPAD